MKSSPNARKNTPKIRIKWPYSPRETEYIQSLVYAGLKELKDIGKWVNYEKFCSSMGEIPDSICAPEWEQYCNSLKEKFSKESDEELRKNIFTECIIDLKNRGLLPSNTSGLTGNFSEHIFQILSEKSQN